MDNIAKIQKKKYKKLLIPAFTNPNGIYPDNPVNPVKKNKT